MRFTPAAVILLLLVPFAGAIPIVSEGMEAEGDLHSDSPILGFVANGYAGAIDDVHAQAASAYALEVRRATAVVDCPTSLCPDPAVDDPLGAETTRFPSSGRHSNVEFSLDAMHSEIVKVLIIPARDADVDVQSHAMVAQSLPVACLSSGGIDETSASQLQATCPDYDADRPGFSSVSVDEEVLAFSSTSKMQITVTGDVVLEIQGIDGYLGPDLIESSSSTETLPDGSSRTSQGFARVILSGAELSFSLTGSQEAAEWAMHQAQVTALGATVSFEGSNAPADSTFTGDYFLAMDATGDAMQVDVEERAPDGSPLSAAPAAPVWQTSWAGFALASIVPLLGVAILVRRMRSQATMADIEAALGSGEYPKAIRMSKTLLRRDPDAPSVQLSHAIALTKAGRPREAVDAVRAYLDRGDPSDGTLHYVMGLALHELGDEAAARSAMDDAVRRTPALADDQHEGGAYT